MAKTLTSVLILSVICSVTFAKPGVHTIRIRFPGASSDKIVLPRPAKQEIAPYPPAGFRPEPAFELPELTYGPPQEEYGPPAEPELTYEPPSDTYGPPELTYGPPDNTYDPSVDNGFQSAAIVNAPLTVATQFTPPRPNKANNFRPFHVQSSAVVNSPLRPESQLTVPRPQRVIAFRPRRPQVQSQQFYPKTYLTLPRVERVIEFRPRRVPQQQQSNFFSRPLPTSIFGNSKKRHSGRQLPSNIFSN